MSGSGRRPTESRATIAGSGKRRPGPESDHAPFQLSCRCQHVRGELALRRRQVEAKVQHHDVPAACFSTGQHRREVQHGAAESIKVRDDNLLSDSGVG